MGWKNASLATSMAVGCIIVMVLLLGLPTTAKAVNTGETRSDQPRLPTVCSTPVFINEFHYDNEGTDTGEFVEVAGPSGTSLSGWSLVLYNGNGGALYDTIDLDAAIPDQDHGFGTYRFWAVGMQNGSPDGLALVNRFILPGLPCIQRGPAQSVQERAAHFKDSAWWRVKNGHLAYQRGGYLNEQG
ncbi:hypothetical protein ACFLYD_00315 [Chloroflexota bacterium]